MASPAALGAVCAAARSCARDATLLYGDIGRGTALSSDRIVGNTGVVMISVVLVDDHELVRTGFRMILSQQSGIEVIGEAADGEQGLALIRRLQPDVAIVDVHMPQLSGIELTDRVRRHKLTTRIVILTVVNEAPFPKRLLEAGASGYLTKGCAADELVRAVRQVADGRRYLSPDVAEVLALGAVDGNAASPFEALSARELDVALMLAQGQDMQHIAKLLKLSAKTVATYKYRLFDKLGVDNPVTLAHLAHLHGLLDDRSRATAG
jgi:DNA-binding NarL/FixJ family response regulator